VPPASVYGDLDLPTNQGGRPYVVLNMVSTVDGKVALNGSAGGIGSRMDRYLMRRIRSLVDAVMIAAGTLRAETCDPRVDTPFVRERRARGLSGQPLAVGVSASLDLLPTNRFLVNGRERTLLLTSDAASSERRVRLEPYATIVTQPGPTVDVVAALHTLYQHYGVQRLLCEGGPTLNQQLLDAGLIDEVFWTLAPKLSGGTGPTLVQGPDRTMRIKARMELLALYQEQSELYAHYRLLRDSNGTYLI
jgi:riboflavin-specific deaminase-like protein